MSTAKYELVFTNKATPFPRHRRHHANLQSAIETVALVRQKLIDLYPGRDDPDAYAGNAIVYGPGCGKDGKAIAW